MLVPLHCGRPDDVELPDGVHRDVFNDACRAVLHINKVDREAFIGLVLVPEGNAMLQILGCRDGGEAECKGHAVNQQAPQDYTNLLEDLALRVFPSSADGAYTIINGDSGVLRHPTVKVSVVHPDRCPYILPYYGLDMYVCHLCWKSLRYVRMCDNQIKAYIL